MENDFIALAGTLLPKIRLLVDGGVEQYETEAAALYALAFAGESCPLRRRLLSSVSHCMKCAA